MFSKCCIKKLDERQLLIRGKVYYRTFSFIIICILINFYIKQSTNLRWVENEWDYLLITLGGVTAVIIQFLYYNIYPWFDKKNRILFWTIGMYGMISTIIAIADIFESFISTIWYGILTEKGASLIANMYYVIIFIVYLVLAHRFKVLETKYVEEDS